MEDKILAFFYELCRIPRRSGDEAGVCAWLCDFAKSRGLEYHADALGDVVIKKPAQRGGQGAPVVLQGHTDMVCASAPGSPYDPAKDGVHPVREGDSLRAEGTTLGADNGIAVAMMLAILDADDLCHPPLECVFTVQEETGLFGAKAIDGSLIRGRTMINLDSEEEGVATVSCAGGKRMRLSRKPVWETGRGETLTLSVDGLRGGHSGTDIGLERQNGIKLLGEALHLALSLGGSIAAIAGGEADNAIPRKASAVLLFASADACRKAADALNGWAAQAKDELSAREPGLQISITAAPAEERPCLSAADGEALVRLITLLPWGVRTRNPEAGGFVVSSENLGVVTLEPETLRLVASLRSSDPRMMRVMSREVETLAALLGFDCASGSEYPGWAYARQSRIRDVMSDTYRALFGKELKIEAIHAGLECGIFCEKLDGLDAIAIGPGIQGCHTPEETLDLPSVGRVAALVCATLERLAK